MAVTTTTFLADLKYVYGEIQNQVSTKAMIMNLLEDGTKMAKPSSDIGGRGYTFLARLQPNWNMGYRGEGTTGVGAAGNQGLANSTVLLTYAYVPMTITGQAENLSKGNGRAFMQSKALEAKYDMEDLISHVNVNVAGTNLGQLATVATSAAGTFTVTTTGLLPGPIYLRVGQSIDVAPYGGGALSISNATITAINYATATVTHNGGTATVGQGIFLTGEASATVGTWPQCAYGLNTLINNAAGSVQGLDASVPGQTAWASYVLDNANSVLSSPLINQIKQFVTNRSGAVVDMGLWSSAQINQLTNVATQTLRFDVNQGGMGKKALDLGFQVYEYAGIPLIEDKDINPDRFFFGSGQTMKKFEAIPLSMAEDEASTWTRISGTNGIADAVQGLLRWYHQVGLVQRSAWGRGQNFLVPTSFNNVPPTL